VSSVMGLLMHIVNPLIQYDFKDSELGQDSVVTLSGFAQIKATPQHPLRCIFKKNIQR